MNRVRILKAKQLEKVLFTLGFSKTRQKGSHIFYKHPNGKRTTIPHHKGKDISYSLLRTILKDIDLNINELNRILKS